MKIHVRVIMDSESIEKHIKKEITETDVAIAMEKAEKKERAVSFFRVLAHTKNGVKVRNGIYFMRKIYFRDEDYITAQIHAKLTGDIVVMIDEYQWINL